jgi:hypothetical protein
LKYEERVNLRVSLLKEFYNDYFTSGGHESKIILERKETEKRLALHYLTDKNLINCRLIKQDPVIEVIIKITAKGIDVVENNILIRNV